MAIFFASGLLWIAAGQASQPTREFIGPYTNGPAQYQMFRLTTLNVRTQVVRIPPHMLTNVSLGTNRVMQRFFTNTYAYTNVAFVQFEPDSLQHHVWTNFLVHTNGRDTTIWSHRSHSATWPTNPPIVKWNTNSLIWGMRGMTAISPCWVGEGAPGQVPLTALTRRHAYTRGHGMGDDGFNTLNAGRRAWFVTRDNSLVEATIVRQVTRNAVRTNEHRDYTIMMFDRDLPESIEPMAVTTMRDVNKRYMLFNGPPFPMQSPLPIPMFQTEQQGHVSAAIPPLVFNTWKGGDSGSPNMIPLPGELVFFSGRSTSGPTPEMQADIDELCRLEKVNPSKYRLRWVDLSRFKEY